MQNIEGQLVMTHKILLCIFYVFVEIYFVKHKENSQYLKQMLFFFLFCNMEHIKLSTEVDVQNNFVL